MTIGTRLTVWYSTVLLVALGVLGGALYFELVIEPRDRAANRQPQHQMEEEIREILLWYATPTVMVTLLGGWWLTRKALRPVREITAAAAQISAYNLGERLPRTGNGDEMDRLAAVINDMLGRLEGSFAREREFTLHASHELKTPLTILRGQLETGLRDEDLTRDQREWFAGQLDEIQRLAGVVDNLSLLARADAGLVKLKREPVRLDELVDEALGDTQMLGAADGVAVSMDQQEEALVIGDRHRLRQLLLILADNALKFNRPGGWIRFRIRHRSPWVELSVANSGDGIPPDQLPRVFDRFFRGDPSHGFEPGGSGLGLSIARWIVTSMGGEITITSDPSKETEVKVLVPSAICVDVEGTRR